MTNPHGTPIWYELLATDAESASTFYSHVIGWTALPSGMEGVDYRIMATPTGEAVAGMMTHPAPDGPPRWTIYFGVDDVDATASAVAAAGGRILMAPMTMAGVGRMAAVADPQGATFSVMRGENDEDSQAFSDAEAARVGQAVWNELTASDPDAAIAFYGHQLGWTQEGAMPMGELGDYRFLQAGPLALGAVMGPVPNSELGWLAYFQVDDIDQARARVVGGGGTVIQEPQEIPGGSYSMVAGDPQAARFGMVGSRAGA